jgi:long-chain acyl-CoA synthetase
MPALVTFYTIPQLFTRVASHYRGQGRTALSYKDRKTKTWVGISWEEYERRVHALAGYLHQQGVRKGDRVAILSENRPEWAIADQATQMIGGVNVSIYTSVPASQVGYIVKDSGSKVLVVSTGIQLKKAEEILPACPDLQEVLTMSDLKKEHAPQVRPWEGALMEGETYWKANAATLTALAEAVLPDDLSALIYTSGTTGNPKGVMLTHRNFCENVKSALSLVPFGPDDHHLSFLPLCHSFERTAGYNCVMACGARVTYAESIDTVSRDLMEVKPTVMISVPRMFERVYNVISKSVEEGPNLKKRIFHWAVETGKKAARKRASSREPGMLLSWQQSLAHTLVFAKLHEKLGGNLRFAVSGGAALPRAIGEFFQAAGVNIIEGYGLTETAPVLTVNPVEAPRYGTVGHVMPGVTIAIQRASDGHIIGQLRGEDYPSRLSTGDGEIIARGPNIMRGYWGNEEATRGAIDADGWYHTGDVGRFDEGYLMITDRIKHMIVSAGGKNIYPGPIEDGFKTVPWIDQVLVIGEGREFLTALVVPNLDNLKRYAQEQGLVVPDDEALLTHEAILDLYEQVFKTYSKQAAAQEKIRDFRLLREGFTIDNGLLTPTLKPRRKAIEQRYQVLIEQMYAGVV